MSIAGHVNTLEDFEGGADSFTATDTAAPAMETGLEHVHNGRQSLKMTYNASSGSASLGAALAIPAGESWLGMWVYGDGSNNKVSVRIRANGASGGIKYRDPETVLDFRGWKHVAWDLANDPYLAFTGADELTGDWRLDSFFLTHQNTDNTPDVPQQSWEGVILFDELEFNKFDASAVRTASISDIELPQGGIQQNGCDGISVIRAGQTLKISADGNIANVEIYNASGSKVISTSPNSGNAEIQLGGLGNGVYIAKVTADNAAKTVKFVK